MIKTAESALNEIETQLRNIRDLTINAANANGNTQTLVADQASITQGLALINRIAEQTDFNGVKLLGTNNIDGKQFQVGANAQQVAQFSLSGTQYDGVSLSANMHTESLGLTGATRASIVASKTFTGLTGSDTESFTVISTHKDGSVATANIVLDSTTGDTIDHAITNINTALATAGVTSVDVHNSDVTGNYFAGGTGYLMIHQYGFDDNDSKAGLVVLTDKSSTDSATGFTSIPSSAHGRNSSESIDVSANGANLNDILNQLDTSLKMVNGLRVNLGAFQTNNMESNMTSLAVAKENISNSESSIRDTDMAAEMVDFTKSQIFMTASQSMLTQANISAQGIISMLS